MPTFSCILLRDLVNTEDEKKVFFKRLLFNCLPDLQKLFSAYFVSFGIIIFVISEDLRHLFCLQPLPNILYNEIAMCRAF